MPASASPATANLSKAPKLAVDEAILTGESEPVNKSAAQGQNMIFMGTTIVTGRGHMRVTQTGPRTELGQIAASLREQRRGGHASSGAGSKRSAGR